MRHSTTLLIGFLLFLPSLSSCRDDFDINTVQSHPKLVLYCMPTVGDTTTIMLTRSLPVNGRGQVRTIDGARISYTVNGKPATILAEGNGRYKAVARQSVGDRISIAAEADSLPAVSAQTTILAPVPLSDATIREVTVYSDYWEERQYYLQLSASFTDPAETRDYYAVQVKALQFIQNDGSSHDHPSADYDVDTTSVVSEAYTESDPVLRKLNSIDYDFGYDDNDYEHFYVFTDDDINGQTYTLHLNVMPHGSQEGSRYTTPYYFIELYHITREFYHFISSIGSIEKSDLTKAGLSNITPNVGNVKGGIGMAAGYASAKSIVLHHIYYQ